MGRHTRFTRTGIAGSVSLAVAAVVAATWLAAAAAADGGDGQSLPPRVRIRDVLADVNATARRQVTVRGVVTWRGGNGLIVQDDSGGIWIDTPRDALRPIMLRCDPAVLARLAPGQDVEAAGWTNRGGYSPNIFPEAIRILGEKPEPEPMPIDRGRFFSGVEDCLRVTVQGLVQGIRDGGDDWLLIAADHANRFTAVVPKRIMSHAPEHLVDADVRIVGVAAMQFNTRGERQSSRLLVVRAGDITVERPPIGSPFEAPEVPLYAIAQYNPDPADGHRIRTQGMVTFAEPAKFLYLQQGTMGVRVETASAERFMPGDRVEVAGFVDGQRDVAGIVEAVVRRIESDRPLQPIRITPDEIVAINRHASYHGTVAAPGDYMGCLVTFPARVVDVQAAGAGGAMLLQSGSTSVVAVAQPETFQSLRRLEPGSEVVATGIVRESAADTDVADRAAAARAFGQLQLLLRSAADMRLVRAPSWWKPHRLAAALAAVAAVAGIAAGWVVLLRRQVARQMGLIETKLQAEATAEERQRIAREFHDSLEQGLAGLSLRLDVAVHEAGDERTRGVLRQQRQLLAGIQTEARGFLWDLRDPVHVEGSLRESITAQLRLLQPLSAAEIVLDAVTPSPDVAPAVQYQLVRIVREAVINAIRHARARRIAVGIRLERPGGELGSVCLTVADDGEGFDIGSRSAVEGHYGLRGMQERARRIGAEFVVESGHGLGTRIVVTVPVRLASAGLGNGEPAGLSA
jgi:signal transduction histidine kinase